MHAEEETSGRADAARRRTRGGDPTCRQPADGDRAECRRRRLDRRVADLEAGAAQPDWRSAPALWQDVGRPPLPGRSGAHERGIRRRPRSRRKARCSRDGLLEGRSERVPPRRCSTHSGLRGFASSSRLITAETPANEDRVGYYGDDHVGYWLSGLADALFIAHLAERHGTTLPTRGSVSRLRLRERPSLAAYGAGASGLRHAGVSISRLRRWPGRAQTCRDVCGSSRGRWCRCSRCPTA